jgi:hypothetical protein
MTGVISGAGSAYPSRTSEITSYFLVVNRRRIEKTRRRKRQIMIYKALQRTLKI